MMKVDYIKEKLEKIFDEFNSHFFLNNHFNIIIKLFIKDLYQNKDFYENEIIKKYQRPTYLENLKSKLKKIFNEIEHSKNFNNDNYDSDSLLELVQIISNEKHIFTPLFDIFKDKYFPSTTPDNETEEFKNYIELIFLNLENYILDESSYLYFKDIHNKKINEKIFNEITDSKSSKLRYDVMKAAEVGAVGEEGQELLVLQHQIVLELLVVLVCRLLLLV